MCCTNGFAPVAIVSCTFLNASRVIADRHWSNLVIKLFCDVSSRSPTPAFKVTEFHWMASNVLWQMIDGSDRRAILILVLGAILDVTVWAQIQHFPLPRFPFSLWLSPLFPCPCSFAFHCLPKQALDRLFLTCQCFASKIVLTCTSFLHAWRKILR